MAVDTGGVDIGPIGQLSGTIPGLSTFMKAASRQPEHAELGRQWKAAKDYNDSAVPWLAGSSNGSAVYGGGAADVAEELGALS